MLGYHGQEDLNIRSTKIVISCDIKKLQIPIAFQEGYFSNF